MEARSKLQTARGDVNATRQCSPTCPAASARRFRRAKLTTDSDSRQLELVSSSPRRTTGTAASMASTPLESSKFIPAGAY
jgi:hypothetical protein